ncbi:MAG: serine/threonine-protein kinase [Planctomycetota bacterium]|nr:serine/threonine-protein kinase [Planctomycetota bacterium]
MADNNDSSHFEEKTVVFSAQGEDEPSAGDQVGRYRVLHERGRGGMGVVYRAHDIQLDRSVALKLLRTDMQDEETVSRFEREARITAQLDHPHLVPMLDLGISSGRSYVIMGYVEGEDLSEIFSREKSTGLGLTRSEKIVILRDACRAVHHAHEHGIVHRDLKPSNIMVDTQGHSFVTDFGLAKEILDPSAVTASGVILGTPSYMAPEQVEGSKELDARADIYSLGALLYTAMCLEAPFSQDRLEIMFRRILTGDFPLPRSVDSSLPKALERIILKAMALKPVDRYESAEALAQDLDNWLEGTRVTARGPGLFRRAQRFMADQAVKLLVWFLLAGIFVMGWFLLDRSPSSSKEITRIRSSIRWQTDLDVGLQAWEPCVIPSSGVGVLVKGYEGLRVMLFRGFDGHPEQVSNWYPQSHSREAISPPIQEMIGGRPYLLVGLERTGVLAWPLDREDINPRLFLEKRKVVGLPVGADLDGNGRKELTVIGPRGKLVAVNPEAGIVKEKETKARPGHIGLVKLDMDGDGKEEVLVVGENDNVLSAFSFGSGGDWEAVWGMGLFASRQMNGTVDELPVVLKGQGKKPTDKEQVVFVLDGARLQSMSLSRDHIEVDWVKVLENHFVTASPTVLDLKRPRGMDILLVGSTSSGAQATGWVRSFHSQDGSPIWRWDSPDQGEALVHSAVAGDLTGDGQPEVVVMTEGGRLYVLDARTGELRWREETPSMSRSRPVLADLDGDSALELICIQEGKLVCLEFEDYRESAPSPR